MGDGVTVTGLFGEKVLLPLDYGVLAFTVDRINCACVCVQK